MSTVTSLRLFFVTNLHVSWTGITSFFVLYRIPNIGHVCSLDPNFIVQISLKLTECSESCPVYKVEFYRANAKGNASYIGEANVEKMGLWDGSVSLAVFNSLCKIIVEKHFIFLNDSYETAKTNLATVYTGVEWIDADGQTLKKVIRNYGNSGPLELFTIEQEIEKTMDQIDWQEVSTSNTSKIIIVIVSLGIILVILVVAAVVFYKRRQAAFRYMQVAREETEEEMKNPFQLNYN